ncbi:hypothetical protein E6C50_02945 [Flavobacterium supellecticarium]|uniref:Uncharacterized protein n=1 Tax=Flavobacterium supellecticarium TaxID=2565924 RepID=A0A4S4A5G8_9FLAO|nr:hypothetical protein [Flavobacterium supellecticarium]THF53175.1 hypothetical protein E6C50_02945 [Flavobacterium supellecticarium]
MTLEGLNTEGVLIFANITKCKAYYSDKEFDYNYPEGLSELVQQGIVHIITTDEAVEVVNFAFDTDEIDLDMWDYHDSYNYLKVDEGDEIRAISHADFTQMCHHYKGDLEAFVDSSLTLKNILNPGFEKTKEEYFKYELPLIALPVGTWKINVYSLKDENVLGWMEFYMHLEKTVTIDVAKIALKPLEIYA